ncbi:MAG: hypothetical protein P1T08_12740 [Acidimicrobiia bacterium]|nr:hypothetical protein [Acidimicrobiia bacterium]
MTVVERQSAKKRSVEFGAEGLMAYLRKWYVTSTLSFTDTVDDQFDIAWTLINHHQQKAGGDFGIVKGFTSGSGRTRTRLYPGYEHKNIFDALVELADVNDGFDFQFRPSDRAFVPSYPRRGRRRPDIIFDIRNIRSFTRQIDATQQASQILGVGAGEGAPSGSGGQGGMLAFQLQDSTATSTYGLTQRPYINKDITVSTSLQDHVRAELAAWKNVPNLIAITVDTIDPPFGSYSLDDEIRVIWPSPYQPVDEFQQVIGIDIEWKRGREQAVLYLTPL